MVAESIERLIIDGVLKVGQPLPSERRLCEKLGFSRSALREGLTVLRGRGIIETAQGRDSRVDGLIGAGHSPLIHLFSTQPANAVRSARRSRITGGRIGKAGGNAGNAG
nr:GntR family transcriptional regulator [Escherichia coli]